MSEMIKEINIEDTDTEPAPEAIPAGKQPFILAESPSPEAVLEMPPKQESAEFPIFHEVSSEPVNEASEDHMENPSASHHRHFTEEEKSEAFHAIEKDLNSHSSAFSPADELTAKITEDHITEYLEGSREARLQHFKEEREKRLLTAFELAAALASVVLVVYFLKDNPAILVNILYLVGALTGLWIWKRPHGNHKDDNSEE